MENESPLVDAVLRPVRGHMAFESCVEQLGSAIRLGVLRPGNRLPNERDLAERMDVSRATLREAISALRAAGLVTTSRGRGGGTIVNPQAGEWTPGRSAATGADDADQAGRRRDVEQTLVFRSILEPGAAYQAAVMALEPSQEALLRDCLAEVEQAGNPSDYRQADARLHLSIATVCGSDALAHSTSVVQTKIHQYLAEIPFLPANISNSDEQHRSIVNAILTGDAESARSIMHEHCDATAALLKGLLK
ncbi:FadR/GntR family transcriptional regulator [Arthrobacter sp. NPDC090010]|uniref:FadR/GntR family transcriptional regulator n=1 Tax=Arthrobacter sp. NPDC090010 TaxID=3363942 RepID=UPI0037FF2430